MTTFQKSGGIAALVAAATFIIGFVFYFTAIDGSGYGTLSDPSASVDFLVANASVMYAWNLVIYLVFGLAIVVLAVSLHERLHAASPNLARVAGALGLLWAAHIIACGMVANVGLRTILSLAANDPSQAAATWLSYQFVVDGLGGGNEIVGGLWIVLLSIAAWGRAYSKPLNVVGFVVGGAGLLTTIPPLRDLGAIFGLGSIAWFIWLGVEMMRERPAQ